MVPSSPGCSPQISYSIQEGIVYRNAFRDIDRIRETADKHWGAPRVLSRGHVAGLIPDKRCPMETHAEKRGCGQNHARCRFSAKAMFFRTMRAIVGSVDPPASRSYPLDHGPVNLEKRVPGHEPTMQSGLVADHHDVDRLLPKPFQGFQGVRVEEEFLWGFHVVTTIPIDDPVSIQKEKIWRCGLISGYPANHRKDSRRHLHSS